MTNDVCVFHWIAIVSTTNQLTFEWIETQYIESHEILHPIILNAQIFERIGDDSCIICITE